MRLFTSLFVPERNEVRLFTSLFIPERNHVRFALLMPKKNQVIPWRNQLILTSSMLKTKEDTPTLYYTVKLLLRSQLYLLGSPFWVRFLHM